MLLFLDGHRPASVTEHEWQMWHGIMPIIGLGGLRNAEVRGLDIPDIDLKSRQLTIRQQCRYGRLKAPKGRTGEQANVRVVPLDPILAKALTDHVHWLGRDDGPAFCGVNKGERYASETWLWRRVRRIQILTKMVDEDGEPRYCSHCWRHFAGSAWLAQGVLFSKSVGG